MPYDEVDKPASTEFMPMMVLIAKTEYERLVEVDGFMACLHAHGVDNWDYWDDAVVDYEKQKAKELKDGEAEKD